jgi:hypothetical protein
MRFLPMLIEWRAKSRLFKWYGDLQQLGDIGSTRCRTVGSLYGRLDEIEQGVNNTRISTNHPIELQSAQPHRSSSQSVAEIGKSDIPMMFTVLGSAFKLKAGLILLLICACSV